LTTSHLRAAPDVLVSAGPEIVGRGERGNEPQVEVGEHR
jgi:hypothetical protein